MARARNAGPALIHDRSADYREIETYYRDLLERSFPPTDLVWEPVKIGPTWDWDGERGWLLPGASLGWGFLSWTSYWLTGKGGSPWLWTPEQTRFLLWFFAVNSDGEFECHTAALQRIKGWGKDPTAAGISTGSLHAPVMFDRWEGDRPVGRDDEAAWTQIVAVSQEQTANTMKLFPSLIPDDTRRYYGIQIGKLNVWSDGDRRQIQAITSNPLSVEGARPHLIVRAETQNWLATNGGHDMVGAMEGNAAKSSKETPARILDIFNAYQPGRDSVAERAREAWEQTQLEDGIEDYGVLWDSLEAPPAAPLTKDAAPDVVRSVAGDATWLDVRPNGRIVKSIMNPENSASESRRKWYNQITGTEDAWIEPRWADEAAVLGKGMDLEPGDRIVLFGDGSKSNDDTGLVAVRLSDGLTKLLWFFHPTKDQIVPRESLDSAVEAAFEAYKVVAFWFDPSHAKDDNATGAEDRFWWPLVDRWHTKYSRRLDNKFWPVKSGDRTHSVAFDMLKPSPQMLFQPAVSQVAEDLEAGVIPLVNSKRLLQHMKNARRREATYGLTVGKENRSSTRKIDLAVCVIGAQMLRRVVLLKKPLREKRGRVILLE